jgi:predicted RNA-binding protein YlqC (UPF0109 family)
LKELVEYLALALAERPEEVRVTESLDEKGPLLHLTVAPEDQSRLIGKEGRTIRAMRTLLAAAAAKTGIRHTLKIADPDSEPVQSALGHD